VPFWAGLTYVEDMEIMGQRGVKIIETHYLVDYENVNGKGLGGCKNLKVSPKLWSK
jgi:hypothetical protein